MRQEYAEIEKNARVLTPEERARRGEGPAFLECKTYRYYGHHVGDVNRDGRPDLFEVDMLSPNTHRLKTEVPTHTALPEATTACPEVAAAISTASMWPAPLARSSRSRLR